MTKDELIKLLDILPEHAQSMIKLYLDNELRDINTIIAYSIYNYFARVDITKLDKGIVVTNNIIARVINNRQLEEEKELCQQEKIKATSEIRCNKVLDILSTPLTKNEIELKTGLSGSTIDRMLSDLVDKGKVRKVGGSKGRGHSTIYKLASIPDEDEIKNEEVEI